MNRRSHFPNLFDTMSWLTVGKSFNAAQATALVVTEDIGDATALGKKRKRSFSSSSSSGSDDDSTKEPPQASTRRLQDNQSRHTTALVKRELELTWQLDRRGDEDNFIYVNFDRQKRSAKRTSATTLVLKAKASQSYDNICKKKYRYFHKRHFGRIFCAFDELFSMKRPTRAATSDIFEVYLPFSKSALEHAVPDLSKLRQINVRIVNIENRLKALLQSAPSNRDVSADVNCVIDLVHRLHSHYRETVKLQNVFTNKNKDWYKQFLKHKHVYFHDLIEMQAHCEAHARTSTTLKHLLRLLDTSQQETHGTFTSSLYLALFLLAQPRHALQPHLRALPPQPDAQRGQEEQKEVVEGVPEEVQLQLAFHCFQRAQILNKHQSPPVIQHKRPHQHPHPHPHPHPHRHLEALETHEEVLEEVRRLEISFQQRSDNFKAARRFFNETENEEQSAQEDREMSEVERISLYIASTGGYYEELRGRGGARECTVALLQALLGLYLRPSEVASEAECEGGNEQVFKAVLQTEGARRWDEGVLWRLGEAVSVWDVWGSYSRGSDRGGGGRGVVEELCKRWSDLTTSRLGRLCLRSMRIGLLSSDRSLNEQGRGKSIDDEGLLAHDVMTTARESAADALADAVDATSAETQTAQTSSNAHTDTALYVYSNLHGHKIRVQTEDEEAREEVRYVQILKSLKGAADGEEVSRANEKPKKKLKKKKHKKERRQGSGRGGGPGNDCSDSGDSSSSDSDVASSCANTTHVHATTETNTFSRDLPSAHWHTTPLLPLPRLLRALQTPLSVLKTPLNHDHNDVHGHLSEVEQICKRLRFLPRRLLEVDSEGESEEVEMMRVVLFDDLHPFLHPLCTSSSHLFRHLLALHTLAHLSASALDLHFLFLQPAPALQQQRHILRETQLRLRTSSTPAFPPPPRAPPQSLRARGCIEELVMVGEEMVEEHAFVFALFLDSEMRRISERGSVHLNRSDVSGNCEGSQCSDKADNAVNGSSCKEEAEEEAQDEVQQLDTRLLFSIRLLNHLLAVLCSASSTSSSPTSQCLLEHRLEENLRRNRLAIRRALLHLHIVRANTEAQILRSLRDTLDVGFCEHLGSRIVEVCKGVCKEVLESSVPTSSGISDATSDTSSHCPRVCVAGDLGLWSGYLSAELQLQLKEVQEVEKELENQEDMFEAIGKECSVWKMAHRILTVACNQHNSSSSSSSFNGKCRDEERVEGLEAFVVDLAHLLLLPHPTAERYSDTNAFGRNKRICAMNLLMQVSRHHTDLQTNALQQLLDSVKHKKAKQNSTPTPPRALPLPDLNEVFEEVRRRFRFVRAQLELSMQSEEEKAAEIEAESVLLLLDSRQKWRSTLRGAALLSLLCTSFSTPATAGANTFAKPSLALKRRTPSLTSSPAPPRAPPSSDQREGEIEEVRKESRGGAAMADLFAPLFALLEAEDEEAPEEVAEEVRAVQRRLMKARLRAEVASIFDSNAQHLLATS